MLPPTVTLEEEDSGTKTRLTWMPHEAGDAEIACFAGTMEGMDKVRGAGMELLAEFVA